MGELPVAEPDPESFLNQKISFDNRLGNDFQRVLQSKESHLVSQLATALGKVDSSNMYDAYLNGLKYFFFILFRSI